MNLLVFINRFSYEYEYEYEYESILTNTKSYAPELTVINYLIKDQISKKIEREQESGNMSVLNNSVAYASTFILLALVIELLVGWPPGLFARIRHPVVWIGALISMLERHLNRDTFIPGLRKLYGMLTTLVVIFVCTSVAWLLARLLPDNLIGLFVEALIASSLLATRSLYEHVNNVLTPLASNNLADARIALAKIVGRDISQLEEHVIAGAALESLAENASDGVIAPVFWGLLLGLPGLVAYKAINTLDSMIGHKSDRYKAFGEFAARLDDVVNWIPARLTAVLIWCCGRVKPAFKLIIEQARHHRSPNAGWPESAMAIGLGIRLSGPRQYDSSISDEPWLNPAGRDSTRDDLRQGLRLYSHSIALAALLLLIISLLCALLLN